MPVGKVAPSRNPPRASLGSLLLKPLRHRERTKTGGGIGHSYYTDQEDDDIPQLEPAERQALSNMSHTHRKQSVSSSVVEMYSDPYLEFQFSSHKFSSIVQSTTRLSSISRMAHVPQD
jgi:hypothetical protein